MKPSEVKIVVCSIFLTTDGESKADVSLPREDDGCSLLYCTVIKVSSWKGVEV